MKAKRPPPAPLQASRLADLRLRDWRVYVLIPVVIIVSSVTLFLLQESKVKRRFQRASLLYTEGKFEQAATLFESLRREKGVSAEEASRALREAADIYFVSLNRIELARRLFEEVVRDYPESEAAYAASKKLAALHEKTGNLQAAIASWRKAMESPQAAREQAELKFRLGESLLQYNRFEEAREYYQQVTAVEQRGHTREQALLRIASIDQMHRRWTDTLQGFREVLERSQCKECRLRAHLGLIDSYESLEDYASAGAVLKSIPPGEIEGRLRDQIERRLREKQKVDGMAASF